MLKLHCGFEIFEVRRMHKGFAMVKEGVRVKNIIEAVTPLSCETRNSKDIEFKLLKVKNNAE